MRFDFFVEVTKGLRPNTIMKSSAEVSKADAIKDLIRIPGVGKSIANDLWNIGIRQVSDLKRQNPEMLFDLSNRYAGAVQDRCLLYVFRCAVYYASHENGKLDEDKL